MTGSSSAWVIYCDGGAEPNPGKGGWGAVLLAGQTLVRELNGRAEPSTNNRMELTAAIEALRALPADAVVHVITDSKYVQQGITQWIKGWMARGWRLASGDPVQNVDLWTALVAETSRRRVTWGWTRGHAGNRWNERADRLATDGRLGRFVATQTGPLPQVPQRGSDGPPVAAPASGQRAPGKARRLVQGSSAGRAETTSPPPDRSAPSTLERGREQAETPAGKLEQRSLFDEAPPAASPSAMLDVGPARGSPTSTQKHVRKSAASKATAARTEPIEAELHQSQPVPPAPAVVASTDPSSDPIPVTTGRAVELVVVCQGDEVGHRAVVYMRHGEKERTLSIAAVERSAVRAGLQGLLLGFQAFKRPVKVEIACSEERIERGLAQDLAAWRARGFRSESGRSIPEGALWRELDAAMASHAWSLAAAGSWREQGLQRARSELFIAVRPKV